MRTFSLTYFGILLGLADFCTAKVFTPLEIDNHPCTPENLKRTSRYICDNVGNVICQSGWRQSKNPDPLHPCSEPICEHNGVGCINGECRSPDYCACEVGWEGVSCDVCIPLPGCENGNCTTKALECNCFEGWSGAYCEIPDCPADTCVNGRCLTPNDCICFDGWTGKNCDQCLKLPGCVNGQCGSHPNTCECNPGWEGHLCDEPVCDPPCVNGHCAVGNDGASNFCICETGWQGGACDQCRTYWACPAGGTCTEPNTCICDDDLPICSNPSINPMAGSPSLSGLVTNPIGSTGTVTK